MTDLIKDTLVLHCSTQSTSGNIMNVNPDYKSIVQYSIPSIKFKDEDIEYVTVSLPYANIPCSFYNVDYYNCQLDFTTTTTNSVLFPIGNYNEISFMKMFLSLMPSGFSITFDNLKGVFTVSYSEAFSFLSSSTTFTVHLV